MADESARRVDPLSIRDLRAQIHGRDLMANIEMAENCVFRSGDYLAVPNASMYSYNQRFP